MNTNLKLYQDRKADLLKDLNGEWRNGTLHVEQAPGSDGTITGKIESIDIFQDHELTDDLKGQRDYRLCLNFTTGTSPLYFEEMSPFSQVKLIKLIEMTTKFDGALDVSINQGDIILYNVEPAKVEEFLRDENSPYNLNHFRREFTDSKGVLHIFQIDKETIKKAIKTMANFGGRS